MCQSTEMHVLVFPRRKERAGSESDFSIPVAAKVKPEFLFFQVILFIYLIVCRLL